MLRSRKRTLAPGRRRPLPPADAPRRARNRGPGRRRPRRPRHAAGQGDAVEPLRSRDARPDARDAVARHARAALPRIPSAHDAPIAIAPLWRALREDPTASFAGIAESVVSEDRAHPVLPGTATAVLRHTERYDMSPSGVVHAIVFDVRRVSGTADVEENAQASAPGLTGAPRPHPSPARAQARRRDRRADPNPGASQGHADSRAARGRRRGRGHLRGVVRPLETGEIGIDTPNLLPTRTAVHDASIEIHLPTEPEVRAVGAPHPRGAAHRGVGRRDDAALVFGRSPGAAGRGRDAEDGPERRVSLSTARWSEIGRGLSEAVAARADHDPAVLAWARDVAERAHAETDRAKVDAVVLATGLAVKEGDPGDLSDLLYGHSTGPQTTTARGILSDHEGSRTWLIVRALRELSVPCEVAVSESEPFSASADFPPHLGRFVHPLAIAHVKPDGGTARGSTSRSTPTSRARRSPPGTSRRSSAGGRRSARTAPSPRCRRPAARRRATRLTSA